MSRRDQRPLYARLLRLHHLTPGGVLCFVFFEGAIALGALLALAEVVTWWGVIALPVVVAAMVKLNDTVAGLLSRQSTSRPVAARAAVLQPAPAGAGEETTRLPGMPGAGVKRPWAERLETQQQWARQSATRRYE